MQTSTAYPSAKPAIGCELARFSEGFAGHTTTSENRLATGPGGAALAYDSTGRLGQVWTSAAITNFDYDGAALIAERAENSAAGYPIFRRYVHGPGEDQPLVWYEGAGLTDKRYLMTDERGSVVAVTTAAGDRGCKRICWRKDRGSYNKGGSW